MDKGNIVATGLGPGDSELITVKGLNALQNADVIFYPASSVTGDSVSSVSLQILEQFSLSAQCRPMHIPMNMKNREQYYLEAYKQIKEDYIRGRKIVIVSEADILFYSTFGYLLDYIRKDNLNLTLIPGIPSFIAAGSCNSIPLVKGNDELKVISCPDSFDGIKEEIKKHRTLIVLKMSKLNGWEEFLENLEFPFLYAEKIGTEHQFVTNKPADLPAQKLPYFSLLIIYG